MDVFFSKTGSDGNATIISDGVSALLIDCGISVKNVQKGSGFKLGLVTNALLTHEHIDHTKYLKNYIERGITFYCSEETKLQLGFKGIYDGYYCKPIGKNNNTYTIDTFKVKPFELPHINTDGADCKNFGYLIYSKVNCERLLFITDTHYIPQQFPPCEHYMLECNYAEIQDFKKELEFIEPVVEGRRFKSHMSLETLKLFLSKQDLSRCKRIDLLHFSKGSYMKPQEMKLEIENFLKTITDREIEVHI